MTAMEDSLQVQRNMNESLKHQLDETRMRELENGQLSDRLHEADNEISRLRHVLQEHDNKAKVYGLHLLVINIFLSTMISERYVR